MPSEDRAVPPTTGSTSVSASATLLITVEPGWTAGNTFIDVACLSSEKSSRTERPFAGTKPISYLPSGPVRAVRISRPLNVPSPLKSERTVTVTPSAGAGGTVITEAAPAKVAPKDGDENELKTPFPGRTLTLKVPTKPASVLSPLKETFCEPWSKLHDSELFLSFPPQHAGRHAVVAIASDDRAAAADEAVASTSGERVMLALTGLSTVSVTGTGSSLVFPFLLI